MAAEPALASFRFHYQVPVRFRDLDALGHAHHSLILIYIEEARAAYWRAVAGRADVAAIDYVVGQVSIRFLQRILFPNMLRVSVRTSRLGTSSFTMAYEIRAESGELLATAETVQVMFDYAAGRSVPLSPELRARLTSYDDF